MSYVFFSETQPKARKDYWCQLCERVIPKGSIHTASRGVGDDGPQTYRAHTECMALTRKWSYDDWECQDVSEFRRELEEARETNESNTQA